MLGIEDVVITNMELALEINILIGYILHEFNKPYDMCIKVFKENETVEEDNEGNTGYTVPGDIWNLKEEMEAYKGKLSDLKRLMPLIVDNITRI